MRYIAIFASFFTLAVAAHAGNALESPKVEFYPTLSAIGIEVAYTGDDNENAQAEFVWRKSGEAAFRNGVDMTYDRKRRLIWASIWPLEQGDVIEVKINFTDPDVKGGPEPFMGTATVRQLILETKGRELHVSPTGDDANPGLKEKPFKTLAHAGKNARAGDTILAATGVYAEGNLFTALKGTAAKPIIIAAAPGAKPVLDSSIQIVKGGWQSLGGGLFAIKANFNGGYVAQNGLRMFPYPALADLKADKLKAKRAWYYDQASGQLYVRTGTDLSPDDYTYNLSQHDHALLLGGSQHVVVRGFKMQYYGASAVRISEGARGCVLYENEIRNSPGGIFMKSPTTQDIAIWKNEIHEPGLEDFGWTAQYAIAYGNQAIYCTRAGRGNSFCHNKIHNYFDLVAVESWKNPDKLEYNRDCDIMFNDLYNASDDAIEVDGGGVNMRVHGNRIRNCLTAISLAPIERGPVYVTRNDATFLGLMFKFNVGGCTSLGWTYCYHNSGYCLLTGADGGTGFSFPPTIPSSNKVMKNNIVMVNEYSVRAGKKGYVLDGNCYFNVPNRPPRRFQWEGKTYNTIEQFRAAVGQEKNGMYADPQFASADDAGKYPTHDLTACLRDYVVLDDSSSGDLRLREGSPCIDAAVPIRGINERPHGKGPDIGCFEFSGS